MSNKFYNHSDYLSHKDMWETIEDLLRGEHHCLSDPKYLWMHPMEDPNRQCDTRDAKNAKLDRALREQRTQYVNYLKMVRERFVSLVMKGGLHLDEATAALLGDFKDNIDGQDHNIDEFTKMLVEDRISLGIEYLLTDARTIQARNLQEESDLGVRPYWIRLHPLSVKDWQIGADGTYQALRYEYMLLKPRASLDEEPLLAYYTTIASKMSEGEAYSIKTYVMTDDKQVPLNYHPECAANAGGNVSSHQAGSWMLVDTADVPELDAVPIATSRINESCLEAVVPVALKIYNKQSDQDNILHNQGYERIFIFSENLGAALGADGDSLDKDSQEIKLSTNSLVVIPDVEGSVQKLDPTNPEGLVNSIQQDIMDMFRIAFNISRIVKESSEVAEGADTKREIKEELITRIEGIRMQTLSVLRKGLKDFATFMGKNYDGEISFSQELTELDLADLLNFARSVADRLAQYPSVRKELDKKMVAHLHLPNEEELFKEIETTEIVEPTVEAGVGKTGSALQGVATGGKKRPVPAGNPKDGKGRKQPA